MKKLNHYIFILLVCMITTSLCAQSADTTATIDFPHTIIAKRSANSIKLRWAPQTKGKWLNTRNYGIRISRAEIINGLPKNYQVIAEDIRVMPEDQLATLVNDPANEKLLAVGYAYYGEWKSMNSNKNQWAKNSDELDSKYLVLLYSCDQDYDVSIAAGLAYEDQNIEADKYYAYRLEIIEDRKYRKKHKSVSIEIDTPPKVIVDQWEENEQEVIIAWDRRINEKNYTGFFIERSKNNNNYQRLNERPYVHLLTDDISQLNYISWTDSLDNYDPHYYRVIGVDAFGDESEPSDPVQLMGRDRTPPEMPEINPIQLSDDQKSIGISWKLNNPKDVEKIIIKKSNAANGLYEKIAEVTSGKQSYTDTNPSIIADQYYRVCAVDTADNSICTYPKYVLIKDKLPPSAPINLEGRIDTNGVVTVVWQLGKEEDLYGYKVHVSHGPNRPFLPITPKPIQAAVYRDTLDLNSLSEYIHFKVTALDLRQNVSEYSKVLRLKKPDLIPPSPAVFKSYKVEKEYVELRFVASTSKDIARHELHRSTDQNEYTKLADLNNTDTLYIDEKIEENAKYSYRLIAIDDDNNKSISPEDINIISLNKKHHKSVELVGTPTPDGYLLKWSEENGIKKVRIYKSINEHFITYKILDQSNTEYLVSDDNKNQYKIKVYYQDGSVSKSSNIVFNDL